MKSLQQEHLPLSVHSFHVEEDKRCMKAFQLEHQELVSNQSFHIENEDASKDEYDPLDDLSVTHRSQTTAMNTEDRNIPDSNHAHIPTHSLSNSHIAIIHNTTEECTKKNSIFLNEHNNTNCIHDSIDNNNNQSSFHNSSQAANNKMVMSMSGVVVPPLDVEASIRWKQEDDQEAARLVLLEQKKIIENITRSTASTRTFASPVPNTKRLQSLFSSKGSGKIQPSPRKAVYVSSARSSVTTVRPDSQVLSPLLEIDRINTTLVPEAADFITPAASKADDHPPASNNEKEMTENDPFDDFSSEKLTSQSASRASTLFQRGVCYNHPYLATNNSAHHRHNSTGRNSSFKVSPNTLNHPSNTNSLNNSNTQNSRGSSPSSAGLVSPPLTALPTSRAAVETHTNTAMLLQGVQDYYRTIFTSSTTGSAVALSSEWVTTSSAPAVTPHVRDGASGTQHSLMSLLHRTSGDGGSTSGSSGHLSKTGNICRVSSSFYANEALAAARRRISFQMLNSQNNYMNAKHQSQVEDDLLDASASTYSASLTQMESGGQKESITYRSKLKTADLDDHKAANITPASCYENCHSAAAKKCSDNHFESSKTRPFIADTNRHHHQHQRNSSQTRASYQCATKSTTAKQVRKTPQKLSRNTEQRI